MSNILFAMVNKRAVPETGNEGRATHLAQTHRTLVNVLSRKKVLSSEHQETAEACTND